MWFNSKLTIVAVCCLSYGSVFGYTTLRKREVSTGDADTSTKDQDDPSDMTDWLAGLEDNGNKSSNSSNDSSNKTADTGSSDDSTSDLGLDTGFNLGSHNTTKDTGSDDSNTDLGLDADSDLDLTGDSDFDTGSKKKTDKGSKKKTTKSKDSAKDTKNKKTNSSTDSSSDLDTDDSYNWPNDQGSAGTNSTTADLTDNSATGDLTNNSATDALTNNVTSVANTTWDNTNANSTSTNDLPTGNFNEPSQNSSQNIPSPSSSTNFTSGENETYPVPQQNTSSTGIPNVPTTTPTPHTSDTKNNGYWIPIFNFGNNFYFMTNKGYAQLVNFPAPVIYSFKPVSPLASANSNPTPSQSEFFEQAEFISSFLDGESSPSFAECYISSSMGNLIPYSYFGSWVAVFQLEQGWHLQTYSGFVPLDLTGDDAPVRYVFEPIKYQYSASETVPTEAAKQGVHDAGLANWSEPVVVEN